MRHVLLALPFVVVASLVLLRLGGGYRALTLGDDTAASLGVDVGRLRLSTIVAVSVGCGACVAVSGTIGFIGLMAPHLVRPFVANDPKRALLSSGLTGALMLTCADLLVRLIPSTSEIRIGVVTALLGAPFFLYVMLSDRSLYRSEGA